jgi:hypothetical protein
MSTAPHWSEAEFRSWITGVAASTSPSREVSDLTVGEPRRNPASMGWLVSFVGRDAPGRIFVKLHREPGMYQKERDALASLRAFAANRERYAVPEIVGWNDQLRLIALKWIDGRSVGPELRAAVGRRFGRAGLDRGTKLAFEIGRWLDHFERRTATGAHGPFPGAAVAARIMELALLVRKIGLWGFDEAMTRRIDEFVAHNVALTSDQYEYSLLHRDFWFDHIWQSGDSIVVIDFGRCVAGPTGCDAAQFNRRLEDLAMVNPMVSKGRVGELQQAFWNGYGRFDVNAPEIRLYTVLTKLEQLGGLVEKIPATGSARRIAILHALAHRTWLRRYLDDSM